MSSPNEGKVKNLQKKKFVLGILLVALAVSFYFGLQWLIFRWYYVSTDDAQVKGNLINLSAKVPGRVAKLWVEEGDAVQAGQILVELERKDYETARAQAQANWEMARQGLAQATTQLLLIRERVTKGIEAAEVSLREAQEALRFAQEDALLQAERVAKEMDRAEANLQSARARILEAKATAENARKELLRHEELFKNRFIAENARDAMETAWQVAESRYQLARENEREALAQLALAQANQRYSQRLAETLGRKLSQTTGSPFRGTFPGDFFVLRYAKVPAVLVEIGFGDHPVEGRRLADPAYREKVAQGLFSGILTFLANGAYAR